MRRAAHLATRTVLVLLLIAAVVDVPLPAASRPRRRLHLIDRSASTSLGPAGSPRPKDADAVVAFDRDRRAPGDAVISASFAGDVRFESAIVDDPRRTDLQGALEAALGRDPTEIVLYSDGRADPGLALLLCRARGVPVHVFPLGAADVHDIRVVRVRAPADAAPGERFPIEMVVEASWPVKARVRLGEEVREIDLAPAAPVALVFPDREAGQHAFVIETPDDCPDNNSLRIDVLTRRARRRVVAVPGTGLPEPGDVELLRASAPGPLSDVQAVIVNGPVPAAEHRQAIARYVREGGGLLLVGGPESFAFGDWSATLLEDVSPLRANPNHRVAVVFAVDTSGSMKDRLDAVVAAAEETKRLFGEGDRLFPATFSGEVRPLREWKDLPREKPEGATNFVAALQWAKKTLDPESAGRKHVLLFTDGVTADKETPEAREAAWKALGTIGLTVITVDRELDIARPNVKLKDVDRLTGELKRILDGIRDTWRERPGPLDLHPHPVTAGLGRVEPAAMNLTSPKAGAQVVATIGRAPAVYPAIAFAQAGHGKSGAIAFVPDSALLSRAIAQVARRASGAYQLSVDPPFVRARGPGATTRLAARVDGEAFDLLQVRSDVWEGRLPATRAGTVLVELADGGLASAVLPCLPEFEKLGVDIPALDRIAAATGGRRLHGSADLLELPPPAPGGLHGGRTSFLLAALILLFGELAIATFWKPA